MSRRILWALAFAGLGVWAAREWPAVLEFVAGVLSQNAEQIKGIGL